MKTFILAMAGSFLLSACAGTAGRAARSDMGGSAARPDWADGVSAEYPRARYLTGAASADDQETAKDRARGEISKVFVTQVTVNTYAAAAEQTSTRQGDTAFSSSQDVMQTVRTTSRKMLEGVEIARTWRDPGTGLYYALAILERSKALAALDARLSDIDSGVTGLNREFSAAGEKMAKAGAALKLLPLLKARESVVADMRVLDPGGPAEPGFSISGIRRDAAAALAALDVAVVIVPENLERTAAEVIKALNSLGIEARTAGAGKAGSRAGRDADIAVECSASFEDAADPDPRSRWKWSKGGAAVSLKDVRADKIFLSFNVSSKEADASPAEARAKAEIALGKKIGAGIGRGISSYFEGQ